MILKLFGGGLLLCAGGYLSFSFARFEQKRLSVLDGYLSLIYYIKGQIDCYAMPLRDILLMSDPLLLAACLGVDDPTLVSAGLMEEIAVSDLPLALLVEESRPYLSPEAERLLSSFSHEIGGTHRSDQVLRCDHYIQTLGEERRRVFETLPSRIRVGTTLCLCAAAGMAVLLW